MYRGHDLAGTNGIPMHADRIPVKVVLGNQGEMGEHTVPREVVWLDGRRFKVKSTLCRRSYGRAEFGNLVERYDVEIGSYGSVRTLWRDRAGWFVGRPKGRAGIPKRNGI